MKSNEELLAQVDRELEELYEKRAAVEAAIAGEQLPELNRKAAEMTAAWKDGTFKSDENTFIRLRNCRPAGIGNELLVDVDCINLHEGEMCVSWDRTISFKPNDEYALSEWLPPMTTEISKAEFRKAIDKVIGKLESASCVSVRALPV